MANFESLMTVAWMVLSALIALGIFPSRNFSYANDIVEESRANICTGCDIPNVLIANREFISGTECLCIGSESITIGEGVTVQNGAKVIFEAPEVNIRSNFQAEPGSIVIIKWDTPPTPPG
jgi:hypothetical protein